MFSKSFLLSFLLICILLIAVNSIADQEIDIKWESFKKQFNKVYENSVEENVRRGNFINSLIRIHEKNLKNGTAKFGINHMSDWTIEEFKRKLGFRPIKKNISNNFEEIKNFLPVPYYERENGSRDLQQGPFDWRSQGVVLEKVKDQGNCGGCWAFAAVGALESAWKINVGDLYSLSEQNFIDCNGEDMGCEGGMAEEGYKAFAASGKKIVQEECYPYKGTNGNCKNVDNCFGVQIQKSFFLEGDGQIESTLRKYGPIAVSVSVDDGYDWIDYAGGVYDGPCGGPYNNHEVVAVGMGYDPEDHYILRNSWGEGYMKLPRNYCGLGVDGALPIV